MTERQSQDRSPLQGEHASDAGPRGQGNGGVVAIGLTGGIGAGKSTALAVFRELGALTISADELVHELYARPSVSAKIGARFGSGVLDAKGEVDRGRLAASVRGRRTDLGWLEDYIHPLVADEIERRIGDAPAGTVVVCEVPLLFESDLGRLFDLVVTVEADRETRRHRSTHDFDIDYVLGAGRATGFHRAESGAQRPQLLQRWRCGRSSGIRPRGIRAGAGASQGTPMNEAPRSRPRTSRRRRRRRLAVLVVLVIGIVTAAVWLAATRAVVPGVSAKIYPIHYRESIARVAEQNDLDPYLVAAVARAESGWDPEAVSHAGATGLMQLMPGTAAWITGFASWQGSDDPDLTNPEESLELGAFYLAYLFKYFGDDTRLALAAYNAGQGTVSGWLREGSSSESLEITDIPIDETREFVERVEYYRGVYTRVHPDAFGAGSGAT